MSLRNGLKYQHQRNAEFKRSFQIYALFHRMKTLRLECKDLMRIKCCCLLACKYRVRTSNKSKARACLCERGQKPLSLSHIQLPARINFLDTPRILNRFLDECCGNRCNLYCYSHLHCVHPSIPIWKWRHHFLATFPDGGGGDGGARNHQSWDLNNGSWLCLIYFVYIFINCGLFQCIKIVQYGRTIDQRTSSRLYIDFCQITTMR